MTFDNLHLVDIHCIGTHPQNKYNLFRPNHRRSPEIRHISMTVFSGNFLWNASDKAGACIHIETHPIHSNDHDN